MATAWVIPVCERIQLQYGSNLLVYVTSSLPNDLVTFSVHPKLIKEKVTNRQLRCGLMASPVECWSIPSIDISIGTRSTSKSIIRSRLDRHLINNRPTYMYPWKVSPLSSACRASVNRGVGGVSIDYRSRVSIASINRHLTAWMLLVHMILSYFHE